MSLSLIMKFILRRVAETICTRRGAAMNLCHMQFVPPTSPDEIHETGEHDALRSSVVTPGGKKAAGLRLALGDGRRVLHSEQTHRQLIFNFPIIAPGDAYQVASATMRNRTDQRATG